MSATSSPEPDGAKVDISGVLYDNIRYNVNASGLVGYLEDLRRTCEVVDVLDRDEIEKGELFELKIESINYLLG